MKILWLTWKDLKNPAAGGAEVVNEELARRLVDEGHQVKVVVGGFAGAKPKEVVDGYEVIRVGNRWTVYSQAHQYVKNNLVDWPEIVIEEMNTIPFMTQWYLPTKKRFLIVHQLCREIWFYQLFFPLSLIGYLIEPIYLHWLNRNQTITISQSSANDLKKYGFKNISVIPMGTDIKPIKKLTAKTQPPILLSLGAIRPMKRTLQIIKAFELAKASQPTLKLIVAGDDQGRYAQRVINYINASCYQSDITILGRVSSQEKKQLMAQATLIAVTSVKEGWGLIITEAASQGTPAVVYNVDGLRDAVANGQSGYLTENNAPNALADKINTALSNPQMYATKQRKGWQQSQQLTFDHCYQEFKKIIFGKNNES